MVAKVAMQPSSHSLPIYTRDPYCRCGNVWAVSAALVKRGFRFVSDILVACMMLPSDIMTWELGAVRYCLLVDTWGV